MQIKHGRGAPGHVLPKHLSLITMLRFVDAVDAGLADQVTVFLEGGQDVNSIVDEQGSTALVRASERGHVLVAHVLLLAGADREIANSRGSTALSLASHNGHADVARLLKSSKIRHRSSPGAVCSREAKEAAWPSIRRAAIVGARASALTFTAKTGYIIFYYAARAAKRYGRSPSQTASQGPDIPSSIAPLWQRVFTNPTVLREGRVALKTGIVIGLGVFTYRSLLAMLRKSTYAHFHEKSGDRMTIGARAEARTGIVEGTSTGAAQVDTALLQTLSKDWIFRSVVGAGIGAGMLMMVDDKESKQTVAMYSAVRAFDVVRSHWERAARRRGVALPSPAVCISLCFCCVIRELR